MVTWLAAYWLASYWLGVICGGFYHVIKLMKLGEVYKKFLLDKF